MKKLIDKFADSPLWVHFIVYSLFGAVFTFLVFKFFIAGLVIKDVPKEILVSQKIISVFIGIVVGFLGVAADWNGRKNDRFFTKLSELRKKAREAKTALELHAIKNDLILFYQNNSCSHPHAHSLTKDLYTMIETRMEFEFKIPQS